jgi:hypothetical protein
MRRTAFLVFTIAALASCGAAAAGGSGVRVKVTAGPTCPVQRTPPDPKCGPRPIDAVVSFAALPSRRTAARTRTGSDGRSSRAIAAGRYRVTARPSGGGPYPRCSPVDVVVRPGRYTSVSINCDSGIR